MGKLSVYKKEKTLHLMLLPGIISVFIFSYIPIVGLITAFQDYIPGSGWYVFGSEFIGLGNFKLLMSFNPFRVLKNTMFIAGLKIVANMVVPIVLAILLNEVRKSWLKKSIQTIIYLPNFLSWVILSGVLIDILSPTKGMIADILKNIGIDPPFFLADNKWFPWVLVLSNTWKEAGFSSIIFIAAITTIDPAQYEAADVDGAKWLQKVINITLPGMMPVIILTGVLSLGNVLNAGFEQVINLYSPIVYESGDILDTFIYRVGLLQANYGIAGAVSFFKSIVSFSFISGTYYLAYKYADYKIF